MNSSVQPFNIIHTPHAHPSLEGQCLLSHWGVIACQGEEAALFLHNQITQDVLNLEIGGLSFAAFCNAKGRVQASFYLLKTSVDEVLLFLPQSVLEQTLKRLKMFVLRAKVKLLDASPMYSLHGLLGHSAQDFLSKQVQTAHANDLLPKPLLAGICSSLSTNEPIHWLKIHSDESHPRIVLCIPQSAPVKELLSHPPHTNLSAWQLGEILSAVPLLQASGFEHYVPQMLNYESVNGVNFKKGCYPGQEVVARSQFRGTLKRRLLLIYAHTTMAPNQELYAAKATDGQPVGELVQTQHVDGVSLGLACIQLPVFDEESEWTTPDDWQNLTEPCLTSCLVTLDSNHQAVPVGLLPLPYALLKDI